MEISSSRSLPHTAFILAGGLGTRLRSVVPDVPKPMAPVDGHPFLKYLLRHWRCQGIVHFILSVGYMGEVIERYFGTSYSGAKITYVREPTPLGTGGALAFALQIKALHDPEILMINGDTWIDASLPTLHQDALQHTDAAITLVLLKVAKNTRYGSVRADKQGLITAFEEKTGASDLINAGCYLLRPAQLARDLMNMPKIFSLEKDLLPRLAAEGKLAASIQNATFIDIGVPEDYARIQREIALPNIFAQ